jgi:carboxyl-terminal processing protease
LIKSIRRLIAAVALFGFVTVGAVAETITAEESFKVVQNMLNLVQTEYIEATPPSQIVTGAFDNLNAALEEKGVAYRVPTSVPEEMTIEEAEKFLQQEFAKVAGAAPTTLKDNWLAHRVIEGMVEGLGDRYTVFMDPEEYQRLKESMSGGNFGGVGIYIELNKENGGRLTVARPIPDTPASDAGLKEGDVILAIDGESTLGYTIDDAQARLRGPLGSEVVLKIRRLNQARPFDVKLIRDSIKVSSVTSRLRTAKGRKVGYIRLQMFGERTDQEMEEAIRKLDAQGAEGYILDLRNNGGGYIISAVDVVSKFLPTGSVVTSVEERGAGNRIYRTRPSLRKPKPLVLLVNQNSASASEITAAALSDHERAQLVGVKTFGKGSVQKIFSLPDGSGVKITTAHYHTPKGKDINDVGIEPNQEVEFEGREFTGKEDTQFLSAAEQLLSEIQAAESGAVSPSGVPLARTGVEQWRYLTALGRGEPEIVDRKYVIGQDSGSLFEEVKVLFPDSTQPEVIKFDLGPALGLSS